VTTFTATWRYNICLIILRERCAESWSFRCVSTKFTAIMREGILQQLFDVVLLLTWNKCHNLFRALRSLLVKFQIYCTIVINLHCASTLDLIRLFHPFWIIPFVIVSLRHRNDNLMNPLFQICFQNIGHSKIRIMQVQYNFTIKLLMRPKEEAPCAAGWRPLCLPSLSVLFYLQPLHFLRLWTVCLQGRKRIVCRVIL
jgi:hypothetical protein